MSAAASSRPTIAKVFSHPQMATVALQFLDLPFSLNLRRTHSTICAAFDESIAEAVIEIIFALWSSNPPAWDVTCLRMVKLCNTFVAEPLGDVVRDRVSALLKLPSAEVSTTSGIMVTSASAPRGEKIKPVSRQPRLCQGFVLLHGDVQTLKPELNIVHLDIAISSNITALPDRFLTGSDTLKWVRLTGGKNVTRVGLWAFYNCRELRSIDLSALKKVSLIGAFFATNCKNLEQVNFCNCQTIGSNAFKGCLSLKDIDLAPLSSTTLIGESFLTECTSLPRIDCSPLVSLKALKSQFLNGCRSVQSIVWGPSNAAAPAVTLFDNDIAAGIFGLVEVDFSGCVNVTTIRSGFLKKSPHLVKVNLSGFHSLKRIGDDFLADCPRLVVLDISVASGTLVEIGENFAAGCAALEDIRLGNVPYLSKRGNNFLKGCSKLSPDCVAEIDMMTERLRKNWQLSA